MIIVGNAVLSDDLVENEFVCDLNKCKGACCVEGDLGAPLTDEELGILEQHLESIEEYLTVDGKEAIKQQGAYVKDEEGDFSTPTIRGRECAYSIYDEKGILKCGIEQAYKDGKIPFQKPISCHLYPIRITQYEQYDALNYDRWSICKDACTLGQKLQMPVYKFVKDALVRKYGADWYRQLEEEVERK